MYLARWRMMEEIAVFKISIFVCRKFAFDVVEHVLHVVDTCLA